MVFLGFRPEDFHLEAFKGDLLRRGFWAGLQSSLKVC